MRPDQPLGKPARSELEKRYPASCPLGYTMGDLERYFGAFEGEDHPLWRQLAGQTGVLCTGHIYNHETRKEEPDACAGNPHGFISYVWDVLEWVERKPVSDW